MRATLAVAVLLQSGFNLNAMEPVPLVDHQVEGVAVAKWVCYAPALPNQFLRYQQLTTLSSRAHTLTGCVGCVFCLFNSVAQKYGECAGYDNLHHLTEGDLPALFLLNEYVVTMYPPNLIGC